MVDSVQKSSVPFRFLLMLLLSLPMVHGSSNVTEIECPSGIIIIISATHNSTIEVYQREAGTNSSLYNEKSSEGYCKAKITISVCTVQGCSRRNVETALEFNPADNQKIEDDDIHFNPMRNQLEVSFRFKALGSYVDQIEEAAKNSTDANAKLVSGKLVELLRFAKSKGFTLDPPRSKEGDWKYVPNLLAPPRTTTAVATSKTTTTASRSSSSAATTTTPSPKCPICTEPPFRLLLFRAPESGSSAAAQGTNSENPGRQNSLGDREIGYIVGLALVGLFAIGCLIWAIIERKKRQKMEKNIESDFTSAVALEHLHQIDAHVAYTELRMIDEIQQEIQDLQQDNSNTDRFKELQNKITIVIGLVDNIKFTFLKLKNSEKRREVIDRLSSSDPVDFIMVDRTENEVESALLEAKLKQRKKEAEDKAKLDQKTKVEAMKSAKEQSSAKRKNKSKDVNDAKGENDHKTKSKVEDAPKNNADAAPKNETEDAPKSKGEAAPNSKAEDAPNSKTEAAPT